MHVETFGNSSLSNSDLTEPQGIRLAKEKQFGCIATSGTASNSAALFLAVLAISQRELRMKGPNVVLI